jgi:Tfp pilus assembly protein PilF
LRVRYVQAAVRCAQLCAAARDHEVVERCATEALRVDPWCEPAAAVLASSALDRGDLSAARTYLKRCTSIVDELGGMASEETRRLQRRLRGARS